MAPEMSVFFNWLPLLVTALRCWWPNLSIDKITNIMILSTTSENFHNHKVTNWTLSPIRLLPSNTRQFTTTQFWPKPTRIVVRWIIFETKTFCYPLHRNLRFSIKGLSSHYMYMLFYNFSLGGVKLTSTVKPCCVSLFMFLFRSVFTIIHFADYDFKTLTVKSDLNRESWKP